MTESQKSFKYLDIITAIFVTVLVVSNITSTKIIDFMGLTVDGGTLIFFICYILGDMLTEVYGYKRSRKIIWLGFMGNAILLAMTFLIGLLPSAKDWPFTEAYQQILVLTPRIVIGSLFAYLAGEFTNSIILAKLKILTHGKKLWLRTISSSLIAQALDTFIFVTIAFYGLMNERGIITLLISNYIVKCGLEILATPLSIWIINKLKKVEHEDFYDYHTNFNPFKLKS